MEDNKTETRKSSIIEFVDLYFTRRMLAIFLMGYASGFPHVLMGSFAFWMSQSDVSLRDIGLFSLAGTPFLLKFLWSPLVDGVNMPIFSRVFGAKKGWLIFMQLIIVGLIAFWAGLDPKEDMMLCVYIAIFISFASATSDIAIDALRVELLERREQGAGATVSVMGYRIAVLVASGVVMIVAGIYSWKIAFYFGAATLSIGIINCIKINHPFLAPKTLEKIGIFTPSTKGDHKNFSKNGVPARENKPISRSETSD
jgi:PAT family beta-lactamase induction signal transducer AmpG